MCAEGRKEGRGTGARLLRRSGGDLGERGRPQNNGVEVSFPVETAAGKVKDEGRAREKGSNEPLGRGRREGGEEDRGKEPEE